MKPSVFAKLLLLTPVLASSLISRQDGCEDSDYTSDIGLDFQIKCRTNAQGNDIRKHESAGIKACIDACASSWAAPGKAQCRAVTYNTVDQTCYEKDGNTTTSDYSTHNDSTSAIADSAPFREGANPSICPEANNTIKIDTNGMQHLILCDTYWEDDNFDYTLSSDRAYRPFHADTVDECLDYCSSNSPLCYGVRWAPTPDTSYRNCWPKKANGTTSSKSKMVPNTFYTSALALLSINSTCTSSSYTSRNNAILQPACDTTGDGPGLKDIHADSFEKCMDECSSYEDPQDAGNRKCTGVLYQPNAADGWLNCYLKYALSNITGKAEWHLATVEQQPEESGGGSNTGVIVGAVVGAVGGLALIAGLVWWFRRSMVKARAAHGAGEKGIGESQPFTSATEGSGGYSNHPPPLFKSNVSTPAPHAEQQIPPAEVPADTVRTPLMELPTGGVRHELQ